MTFFATPIIGRASAHWVGKKPTRTVNYLHFLYIHTYIHAIEDCRHCGPQCISHLWVHSQSAAQYFSAPLKIALNWQFAYVIHTHTNLFALRPQSTSADAHNFNCCHYISHGAYHYNIPSCCHLQFAVRSRCPFQRRKSVFQMEECRPKYALICVFNAMWHILLHIVYPNIVVIVIIFIVVDVGSGWHA